MYIWKMFAIIRQYHLNPIFRETFIRDWNTLIHTFRANDAFVSASLHQESNMRYIAYEKWKSKDVFLETMNDHNGHIRIALERLKDNCNDMALLHSMEVVDEYQVS